MDDWVRPVRSDIVGVCYLTARVDPGSGPDDLVVRVVSTLDVNGGPAATRVVRGVDAACSELRRWFGDLCSSVLPDPD